MQKQGSFVNIGQISEVRLIVERSVLQKVTKKHLLSPDAHMKNIKEEWQVVIQKREGAGSGGWTALL